MFCSKCGNKLKEGSAFCGKCGQRVSNKGVVASNKFNMPIIKNKFLIIISLIIIAIIVMYLIVFNVGKNNLSKELLRDWSRVEIGDSGSSYELELDFSDDKIEYNFKSSISWLNKTLHTYEYEIISPNKIKINNKEIQIEFNSDKSMMTMSPAITSVDEYENWYNED